MSGRSQICRVVCGLILAALVDVRPCVAQDALAPLKLGGRVVDARTGAGLERVLVLVEDTGHSTFTDREGRFDLSNLGPGPHRLYISVIGYILVRREVVLTPGATADLTIPLSEGTGTYSETVTVTPDVFRTPPDPVVAAQVLGSAEIQNLRGVLADDPLRAVQALPGVATGDDFRSEFTVRGSDFRHITFTVDGFATPYLVHTVRGVEDKGPTGSVAMINSDVLEDVTLLNGGYAQRYGGHTGAEVDFRLREGSRDRRLLRIAASATNASAVLEGPIGSSKRGSWLVSGRQSYLDLLVRRLTDRSIAFGFSDAQARFAYDASSRQRLDVTLIAGRSRFEEAPEETGIDSPAVGRNASVVAVGGWRLTLARAVVAQRILLADNHFQNVNRTSVEIDRGSDRQFAYRADVTVTPFRTLQIETGGEVERLDDQRLRRRFNAARQAFAVTDDYSGDAARAGGYALARWSPIAALTVSPGFRVDRWSLTGQARGSPWAQVEWRMPAGRRLRAAAGVYQQFPDFDQVLGVAGAQNLRPEHADQFDAGFEQRIGASARASIALYDREDSSMLRRPGVESRLVAGRIVRGSTGAAYANRLSGYARGVELLVQRSSANGLTGWISYSYGRNHYRDVESGERFWGDFDQRHTFNASAAYRRSDRASFVAKLRVGSNFPITGYFVERDGSYFVTDVRNTSRLPTYARLDLRTNHTFNWSRRRLTLFAEVINVLNRENVRFTPPSINSATHQTSTPFARLLPVVPSAGVLIEF